MIMKSRIYILSVVGAVLFAGPSWAGGAVAAIKQRELVEQQMIQQEIVRRQQAEMVKQYMAAYQQAAVQQYVQAQKEAIAMRAAQEQAVQQLMAQRMVEEITAFQIASVRRDQMLAQQTAIQIRVVQDAQMQQMSQMMAAQQAQQYQQQVAVAQLMASQQQKTLEEYQQALLLKDLGEKAAYTQMQEARVASAVQGAQQIMAYQAAASMMNKDKMYEDIPSSYVKEVVKVSDLWESLDKSSKAWPLIIDRKAKGVTVSHYIEKLSQSGAKVTKDPMHYADMIDSMYKENPSMLAQPFLDLLRIMAIIEYDFDNGIDKDAMARRIFPDDKSFQANKKRLGM